jgi:hypothetical protein
MVPLKKISLLVDYPLLDLSMHPSIRLNKPIREDEIWFILDCVTSALAFTQRIKFRCSSFSVKDIY